MNTIRIRNRFRVFIFFSGLGLGLGLESGLGHDRVWHISMFLQEKVVKRPFLLEDLTVSEGHERSLVNQVTSFKIMTRYVFSRQKCCFSRH